MGEAIDRAGIRAPLVWRGFGFRDGNEDCDRFRRACFDGQVKATPSLLLRSAFADAVCLRDPANNIKLAKARSIGRIDAAAATVLAVAEGARMSGRARQESEGGGMGLKRTTATRAAVHARPAMAGASVAAKRRDGLRCVQCGARGRLEVDHVQPVRSHPELAFDLDNLQTLCASCHSRKTRNRSPASRRTSIPQRAAWRDSTRKETLQCLNV